MAGAPYLGIWSMPPEILVASGVGSGGRGWNLPGLLGGRPMVNDSATALSGME